MIEIVETTETIKIEDKEYIIHDLTTKLSRKFIHNQTDVTTFEIVLDASSITKEEIEDMRGSVVEQIALEILKLSGFDTNSEDTIEDGEDPKKK